MDYCRKEACAPVLEQYSGLKFNRDFYSSILRRGLTIGYGVNILTKIKKVTSGSISKIVIVDAIYVSVIEDGTYKLTSIKETEANKNI